jgi:hypothetical protein
MGVEEAQSTNVHFSVLSVTGPQQYGGLPTPRTTSCAISTLHTLIDLIAAAGHQSPAPLRLFEDIQAATTPAAASSVHAQAGQPAWATCSMRTERLSENRR